MNLLPTLQTILEDYVLPIGGDHGVAHWARVLENGLRLAEETGANVEVVQLFAILHDSRRINEVTDPEHGPRAAEFAAELRGTVFDLDDHDFRQLYRACEGHTHERKHPDVTIQTCWDSDRLDLGRVGIMPHPTCTNRSCSASSFRRHSLPGTSRPRSTSRAIGIAGRIPRTVTLNLIGSYACLCPVSRASTFLIRHRSVVVTPRNIDLKMPSDLLGLNPLTFSLPSESER